MELAIWRGIHFRLVYAPALLGIHARCLGHRETVSGHGAGQDRSLGCSALDHPEGLGISIGAAGDPGDGPVDPGGSGGEISGFQLGTSVGGEDRVDVVACVPTPTTNGWVWATRDMAVIRTFLFTDMVMAVIGRHQSG